MLHTFWHFTGQDIGVQFDNSKGALNIQIPCKVPSRSIQPSAAHLSLPHSENRSEASTRPTCRPPSALVRPPRRSPGKCHLLLLPHGRCSYWLIPGKNSFLPSLPPSFQFTHCDARISQTDWNGVCFRSTHSTEAWFTLVDMKLTYFYLWQSRAV